MESKQVNDNAIEFWIACSGGLDSVFLVYLFSKLNKKIGILHCNFKLRGNESEEDEIFVRNLAKKLNIPIQVKVLNVNNYKASTKSNTQLAARELRYDWFDEVKAENNSKVVLGHHKDDQRETFFLQLLRGASVNGLSAMPYQRNGYVRPLLNYSKSEIKTICLNQKWKWREDSSNQLDDYKRNDLRLNLIPKLVSKGVDFQLVDDLILHYQRLLQFIQRFRFSSGKEYFQIEIRQWNNLPLFFQNALLEEIDFGKNNLDLVNQIANSEKGAYGCRNNSELWNEGDYLLFKKEEKIAKLPELLIINVQPNEVDYTSNHLFVDADCVKGEIYIRYWTDGDEFSPLGMKGNKKISDFLKDKKVPSSQKKHQIVACDNQGVIGVLGFLPANRVKISNSTKLIFQLSVQKSI